MQISSLDSKIVVAGSFEASLKKILAGRFTETNSVFIIVDENTKEHCLPLFKDLTFGLNNVETKVIEIHSGEVNKSLATCELVWNSLSQNKAGRNSLVVNLGGGMVCDLGGFAAATYKRGIDFINIPTTLLAQVDAAIGGKLAVNLNNVKNEIGIFRSPKYVIIDTIFLKTLDKENILSGFSEMIKHALIYSSSYWTNIQQYNIEKRDLPKLEKLISKSIFIKSDFVKYDPKDKDMRRGLNFGNTIGFGFEDFMERKGETISRGKAIAHGMICELFLSHKKNFFPFDKLNLIARFVLATYGKLAITNKDFSDIISIIKEKRMTSIEGIPFTLLEDIGEVSINEHCTEKLIHDALQFHEVFQTDN